MTNLAIIKEPQFMTPTLALADSLRIGGDYEAARCVLADELPELGDDPALRLAYTVALAKVERGAGRLEAALRLHLDSASLADGCADDELRARFHLGLATTYQMLGLADSALLEYPAASYFYELAGLPFDAGCIENNVALLFSGAGRFDEAHAHIARARICFDGLPLRLAEVDESEAQIFLAEGKPKEAERLVLGAMCVFHDHGETELLRQARYALLKAAADCQAKVIR